MRPERQDIAVPPFPPSVEWIGQAPGPVERVCARGPLVVALIDAAHPSSVRALPYLGAWDERYREHGLTVLAVNSPRFPFTAEPAKLEAALALWDARFPVAVDSGYAIWHDYGAEGWPSLFLWGRGGALRWFHLGEGEYRATEEAIQGELRAAELASALPEPLSPFRPAEVPGVEVARPSDELLPGGSESRPWRPDADGDSIDLEYGGAGAWVTVDGRGSLGVSLDGGSEQEVPVEAPGAYELSQHEGHEAHRLRLRVPSGIDVYAISFAAGLPAPGPTST